MNLAAKVIALRIGLPDEIQSREAEFSQLSRWDSVAQRRSESERAASKATLSLLPVQGLCPVTTAHTLLRGSTRANALEGHLKQARVPASPVQNSVAPTLIPGALSLITIRYAAEILTPDWKMLEKLLSTQGNKSRPSSTQLFTLIIYTCM
jgi:hypothetical protein